MSRKSDKNPEFREAQRSRFSTKTKSIRKSLHYTAWRVKYISSQEEQEEQALLDQEFLSGEKWADKGRNHDLFVFLTRKLFRRKRKLFFFTDSRRKLSVQTKWQKRDDDFFLLPSLLLSYSFSFPSEALNFKKVGTLKRKSTESLQLELWSANPKEKYDFGRRLKGHLHKICSVADPA